MKERGRHGVTKSTGDPDAVFREQFRIFEIDAEAAAVHAYTYFAIHGLARRRETIEGTLHTNALFWGATVNGHQIASLVKLGKIFDQDSTHNVDRLMGAISAAPEIFSKSALGERKKALSPHDHIWLDDYLASTKEPSVEVFREWRRFVKKLRSIYGDGFRELRHAFNHTKAVTPADWAAIVGKTSQVRLKRLVASLLLLRREIEQLYWNGRLPMRPRRLRYSARRRADTGQQSPLHEQVVAQTEAILGTLRSAEMKPLAADARHRQPA